jgi:hypothetical protein
MMEWYAPVDLDQNWCRWRALVNTATNIGRHKVLSIELASGFPRKTRHHGISYLENPENPMWKHGSLCFSLASGSKQPVTQRSRLSCLCTAAK